MLRRIVPVFLAALIAVSAMSIGCGHQTEYRPHYIGLDSRRPHGFPRFHAENHAESRCPGPPEHGFRAGLFPGAADRGLARNHTLRHLPADAPGKRIRQPACDPLCRLFRTCSRRADITLLPSSVQSRSIRRTDWRPASIADSLCTTRASSRCSSGPSKITSVDRPAAQVVARATDWLAHNAKGPFFLWVHLNDPEAASATSYNASVAATDAAIGKLIAALRASKMYDDTLIVIASDHGESLGAARRRNPWSLSLR